MVQTDLEKGFGEYRQLSGGNNNVSVQQVCKSEKKNYGFHHCSPCPPANKTSYQYVT